MFSARAGRPYSTLVDFTLYEADKALTSVSVGYSGGFNTYKTFDGGTCYLTAGTHEFMVQCGGDNTNINWFELLLVEEEIDNLSFEAEDAIYLNGVSVKAGSDEDGTAIVSGIGAGDTMTYRVAVPEAGQYMIVARASKPTNSVGTIAISEDDSNIGIINIVRTGSWAAFTTQQGSVLSLAAGEHEFDMLVQAGEFNLNWFELIHIGPLTETGPDILLQAEEYDSMYGVAVKSGSAGSACVYNIQADDWMKYTLRVTESGEYKISVSAATPMSTNPKLQFRIDGVTVATAVIGHTGAWQVYKTFDTGTINLEPGRYEMTVYAENSDFNIDWIQLEYLED
jgi:hypothetical protein